jgi:CRP-like cAMP-binding protein
LPISRAHRYRVIWVRKVLYILGRLEDEDIDWFVENGERRRAKPGTVLITEGKPVDVMHIVLEGHLQVTARHSPAPIATLGAGEVVGELSFLDARPPSATVTAEDDVTVLAVKRAALSDRLKSHQPFAARFYHALGVFLADRLRSTVTRLGYEGRAPLEAESEYDDEIDDELLDGVSLAGKRFEWILRRLRAGDERGHSRADREP